LTGVTISGRWLIAFTSPDSSQDLAATMEILLMDPSS
jgi:hypothetical protein